MTPPLSNLPLYRTAWRRVRRRPLEYTLFILGIALGVAMLVSIALANRAASRAFALSTEAVVGRATHRVIASSAGLDEALYIQLKNSYSHIAMAPVVEGLVSAPALSPVPLRLVGVDPFAEAPFRDYLGGEALGDGALAFLTTPNGVLLAAEMAAQAGLRSGQTFTLSANGRPARVVLIGQLAAGDDLSRRGLADLALADIAVAQELLGMVGRLSRIDLILTQPADLALVQAALPPGVALETAAAQSNTIQQMTAAFELNLTALSLLALVVGMFLIYNTVTFSVVQRRPLFAILRSLGVTAGQLTTLILVEAGVLGLIGSLLGVGLGIILGQGMVGLVAQTINDLYFVVNVRRVEPDVLSLVRGVGVGVGAALAAAAVPALEARRTPPNTALQRSSLEGKMARLLPRLALAGLVIGAAGALALGLSHNLTLALAGVFAVLFACALLTPGATVLLMRALEWLGGRTGRLGVLGHMGPRDIVRALSRTSVAIAALMTAVSVIIGVSIMVGSFRLTLIQWLDQTLQADIYLSPPTFSASDRTPVLDPAVVAQAQTWPGVVGGASARHVQVMAPAWGRSVQLLAISDDLARGGRPLLWHNGDPDTLVERLLAGEGVMLSEPMLIKQQLSLPPAPVTLLTPQGPRTFPVLAVAYDYTSEQGFIWIGRDLYTRLWQDEAISTLALFVAPGVDVDVTVADLRAALGPLQQVTVQSNAGLRQSSLAVFDRTFAITAALRLLATVVAFIGVLSALLSLQLERAREWGTLRAIGLTPGQLWRLMLWETGLMGGTAGLLALPTGTLLAWILITIINRRAFGWTLQMYLEPAYFLSALLVAIVAAGLAGLYPAWRLGRQPIATALRSD